MPEIYPVQWLNMDVSEQQRMSVAVCTCMNKVRDIAFGNHEDKKKRVSSCAITDDGKCTSSMQCLAIDCDYNQSTSENILRMFDMKEDVKVDAETAEEWHSDTLTGCYVAMAKCISDDYIKEK